VHGLSVREWRHGGKRFSRRHGNTEDAKINEKGVNHTLTIAGILFRILAMLSLVDDIVPPAS